MKNTVARAWIAFITLGFAALFLPYRVTGQGSADVEVLTNESVVQMVVGKVPKDLILAKIQSTSTAFDITANGLVNLYQSKVSTDMIKVMMKAATGNSNKEVLANDAIVYMVTSRLPRDLILATIQSSTPGFDLTAAGLVSLNQNKVPQAVVKAMMAVIASPSSPPVPSSQPTLSAQSPATPVPPAAGTLGSASAPQAPVALVSRRGTAAEPRAARGTGGEATEPANPATTPSMEAAKASSSSRPTTSATYSLFVKAADADGFADKGLEDSVKDIKNQAKDSKLVIVGTESEANVLLVVVKRETTQGEPTKARTAILGAMMDQKGPQTIYDVYATLSVKRDGKWVPGIKLSSNHCCQRWLKAAAEIASEAKKWLDQNNK